MSCETDNEQGPDLSVDTRTIQQQSHANSHTSHSPAQLVDSFQTIPATTSSNRSSFTLSPLITTQPPSSPPILLKAHDNDPAHKRTNNRPQSTVEDSRDNEDVALPHSRTSQTDFDRGSTTIVATPCYTLPRLPGGRELSPSLQESSTQQSPSGSPSLTVNPTSNWISVGHYSKRSIRTISKIRSRAYTG